jgi:inorganic pyrophosphatase
MAIPSSSVHMDWTGEFWLFLDQLVAEKPLVIDRPRDSAHPRYPDMIYPLDYGYLEGTRAVDGGGIDVWVGASGDRRVSGILCSVDLKKHDAEVKILLGCSRPEVDKLLGFMNGFSMRAIYVERNA